MDIYLKRDVDEFKNGYAELKRKSIIRHIGLVDESLAELVASGEAMPGERKRALDARKRLVKRLENLTGDEKPTNTQLIWAILKAGKKHNGFLRIQEIEQYAGRTGLLKTLQYMKRMGSVSYDKGLETWEINFRPGSIIYEIH